METLGRTDLYWLVWLEPVSTLAPRLNVSGAKLSFTPAGQRIKQVSVTDRPRGSVGGRYATTTRLAPRPEATTVPPKMSGVGT